MIETESNSSQDCFPDQEEIIDDKIFYKGLRVINCPQVHFNLVKSLKKYLNPFCNIIDLGSGTGALALRLKDENFNIVASGIEPDDFSLINIKYYYIDLNKDISVEHHGVYDGVVASEVIEHLENIFDFFRKIYMMLRPNGFAFITTPNILSVLDRLIFFSSGNFYFFTPEDFYEMGHQVIIPSWLLRKAAEKAGFKVRDLHGIGNFMRSKMTWQTIIFQLALLFKVYFYKESFWGEFTKSNILMVVHKV